MTDESLSTLDRILFRLNWIEKALNEREKIIKNGNLASWEPEVLQLCNLAADLTNTFKEFIQQEQGPITPPNVEASAAESPEPA